MARPITTERDYRGVKNLVAERAWTFFFVETERLEALVRELTDYELRVEEPEAGFTVEWAESAFVQKANDHEDRVVDGVTCSIEDLFATCSTERQERV